MPVTLAHPAAVLPLRGLGLPTAALVIGSMVPDTPLFLGPVVSYGFTHSLVGVLTVDLVAALLLLAAWDGFVRDALVDLSPGRIRDRFPSRRRLGRRAWLLAPAAAVVGSVTHVVWDAFTHPGRWGVEHLGWLQDDLGPLPGYKWSQYLSGVLGTAVVVTAVVWAVAARAPDQPPRPRALPAAALPLVVLAAGLLGAVAGLRRWPDGLHAVAFDGVVGTIVSTSVGVLGVSVAWLLVARSRRGRAKISRAGTRA